jgi:NAD+ kinase
MITKVFVSCKMEYGRIIKEEVKNMLRQAEVSWTETPEDDVDLAILIGGDGTFLKSQWRLKCPIMGINAGKSVGFYMTSCPEDFRENLFKVLKGVESKDYFVHRLPRLRAELNGESLPQLALNEVLVSPIYSRRIFDSEITVKGEATLERGSGILVYTPTGSNAFAHSAGARPFKYSSKKFGIMEIAPYTGRLKRGRILFGAKGSVSVKCLNNEGEVCIDGQDDETVRIKEGDMVRIRSAGSPARVIGFTSTALK